MAKIVYNDSTHFGKDVGNPNQSHKLVLEIARQFDSDSRNFGRKT